MLLSSVLVLFLSLCPMLSAFAGQPNISFLRVAWRRNTSVCGATSGLRRYDDGSRRVSTISEILGLDEKDTLVTQVGIEASIATSSRDVAASAIDRRKVSSILRPLCYESTF